MITRPLINKDINNRKTLRGTLYDQAVAWEVLGPSSKVMAFFLRRTSSHRRHLDIYTYFIRGKLRGRSAGDRSDHLFYIYTYTSFSLISLVSFFFLLSPLRFIMVIEFVCCIVIKRSPKSEFTKKSELKHSNKLYCRIYVLKLELNIYSTGKFSKFIPKKLL